MTTSENIVFVGQFEIVFWFYGKSCSIPEIFLYILNHSLNFECCYVMVSNSAQRHVYFWIYLFCHKWSGHENSHRSYFWELLCMIYHFCFTNQLQSINDQLQWNLFFPLKVYTDTIKNSKDQLLKISRLHCSAILSKSYKGSEPVSCLYNRANMLEIIFISCTNIWPNFTLMLTRILKKQSKTKLLLCSNAYDVCELTKNTEIWTFENKTLFFLQMKKIIHYALKAINGKKLVS